MSENSLAFVLGTRPEIIKMAPIIQECENRDIPTVLIHTGQHYSESLDAVFFRDLELPEPTYNLQVGSETHGEQTGEMLAGIEDRLLDVDSDVVFVQGDTNSTLAGALAASKLDTDVAHVEAGLRSFDREMPEETNRTIVDHISDYLFPPTEEAAQLLREEGIPDSRITVTGNTIADAVMTYSGLAATRNDVLSELGVESSQYCLLTAHRSENVDDPGRFSSLLNGVDQYARAAGWPVIYPIHPRAQQRLDEFNIDVPQSIKPIEPRDFFDFLRLESEAALVFTDSGGVQEETCILGTPCVTLRYNTERPETVHVGSNCLAGLAPSDIVAAADRMVSKSGDWESPFGDGRASERIVAAVSDEAVQSPSTQAPQRSELLPAESQPKNTSIDSRR